MSVQEEPQAHQPYSHPTAGKDWGGGPRETWQQELASSWVSDLEDLHWVGDQKFPPTTKSGSRTRAALAHPGGQAGGHVTARDETGTGSPTSALQHGLGFPAHTSQLPEQAQTPLHHLGDASFLHGMNHGWPRAPGIRSPLPRGLLPWDTSHRAG